MKACCFPCKSHFSQMTISVPTEAISLIKFFLTVDHVASGRLGPSVYYIWLFEISYIYIYIYIYINNRLPQRLSG